ncbi:MAG TPA: tetratricopeptide repeat protein [Anaeromyxobacter sp.]|nr:tetratricopeptide repeat protein [Anaeromyxobacter sp.]
MSRRGILAGAALAAASLPGCWVPMEKGRQLEARVQRLEVQNVEQQRLLDETLKERIAKADEQIGRVQTKIEELNAVSRKSGANLAVELGKLQEEFARVKGDLEASQHRLAELEKSLKALDASTEGRFAALKGAGALDEHEARQKLAALKRPDDKGAVFELAQREEKDGDKGVARQMYEEYARRWPSDPRTAEARFRAGEIAFGQKRWRDALLSYGKVAEDFPRSDVAPDAMLGAAEAMLRLDMKDDARAVLDQLVEKYPKSKAAGRAKDRLTELPPPPPPPPAPAEKKKPAPKKK